MKSLFQYQVCKLYSLLILRGYLDYKHVHLHLFIYILYLEDNPRTTSLDPSQHFQAYQSYQVLNSYTTGAITIIMDLCNAYFEIHITFHSWHA